jgi:hypothetical protein
MYSSYYSLDVQDIQGAPRNTPISRDSKILLFPKGRIDEAETNEASPLHRTYSTEINRYCAALRRHIATKQSAGHTQELSTFNKLRSKKIHPSVFELSGFKQTTRWTKPSPKLHSIHFVFYFFASSRSHFVASFCIKFKGNLALSRCEVSFLRAITLSTLPPTTVKPRLHLNKSVLFLTRNCSLPFSSATRPD